MFEKKKGRRGEGEEERVSIYSFTHPMAAYPDLRPVEVKREQLHPSLPCGLEGPKHYAHLHCFSRLTRSQIGSGAARKPGLKPAVFIGFQCHEVQLIPLHHTTGPFGNYFLTKNLGKKEKKYIVCLMVIRFLKKNKALFETECDWGCCSFI